MSLGLVRDWSWKRPFAGIGGLNVKYQCRLFHLVQALIFGVRVGSLECFFELCVLCLVGLANSSLVILVPICRLRHIGWEKCGHGLTSRPRESASEDF